MGIRLFFNNLKAIICLFCVLFTTFPYHSFSQSSPVQVRSIFGNGDNSDRYNAMVVDVSGNLLLGGYTYNTGKDKDYLVIKMTSSGSILWTRTYDGADNGSDKIFIMRTDPNGNVYVSGECDGGGINQNDIVTQKYSSSGTLLWSATYNSIYNQDDSPLDMEVDNAGNVFVVGSSDRDSSSLANNDDGITLKYNSNGVLVFEARVNGSANATDRSSCVKPDNTGGCYVAGRTALSTNDDAFLIRYSTTGNVSWQVNYDQGVLNNERAEALSIDASGNILVTGRATNLNDDVFLNKYSPSGALLYNRIYNNVENDRVYYMRLDPTGNIYLLGQTDVLSGTGTNYNYMLLKYNTAGNLVWSRNYGSAVNNDEDPSGMAFDASGSIFITGKSDVSTSGTVNDFLTVKYDSSGTFLWSHGFSGNATISDDIPEAIAVVGNTIYVAGGSANLVTQKDAAVFSLNQSGVQQWIQQFNGQGDFTDKVQALTVDSKNNLYVTGYVFNPEMRKDLFTAKYNASGVLQWFRTYDFAESNDEGKSIAVDTSGNVYVCGNSIGNSTSDDYITIKYDASGNQLWTARYDFNNEADVAVSIGLLSNGNIVVTGYSDANQSSFVIDYDITTLIYTPTGVLQNEARYGNPGVADRGVKLVCVGSNVYVAGRLNNGTDEDIVLIRYSSILAQQWASTYSTPLPLGGNDVTRDLYYDGVAVYVAGNTTSSTQGEDYILLKYSTAGVLQWNANYNGPANRDDRINALTGDATGIYVTGRSAPSLADSADIVTMKFNKNTGAVLWNNRYSNGTQADRGNFIHTDRYGRVYVTAESFANASGSDFMTISYTPSTGNREWTLRYDAGTSLEDVGRVSVSDTSGFLYVAGYGTDNASQRLNALVLKYCPPPPVNAGPDVTICSGTAAALNAAGALSYLWSPSNGLSSTSVSNPSASPFFTRTYTVTGTSIVGCTASDQVVVTVNPKPSVTINPSGTVRICSGDSLLLSASSSTAVNYQWYKGTGIIGGATGTNYTAKTAATYKVRATNTFGCTAFSGTAKLEFSPTATISASGPTTFCNGDSVRLNAVTGTGYTYQWQRNSVAIAGANTSSYTVKNTGFYRCLVSDINGCTKSSNGIQVSVNCRQGHDSGHVNRPVFTVHPNPFSDSFRGAIVNSSGAFYQVRINDVTGKCVLQTEITDDEFDIDTHGWQAGIYFITLTDESGSETRKLIKQQ